MPEYLQADAAPEKDPAPHDKPSDDKGPGDKPDKGLLESARLAAKWTAELNASKKWLQKFTERAKRCERAYIDEGEGAGGTLGTATSSGNKSRVNLFWSNVEVTLAAIYGRLPKATVDRRFKDQDDDTARVAAEMLQRILNADIEREYDDTNAAMRDAVQDRFVTGLGQCWCRYDVQIEDYDAPELDELGQPTGNTIKAQRIVDEDACTDYVYWEDFRYAPCRRWRDCRWVARAVLMNERILRKRFKLSDEQLAMVPMSVRSTNGANNEDVLKATPFKQARVWEIWDRETYRVVWYAEGCTYVLDVQDDILGLEDFFPCPQPVVATTLTRAFLPKADYVMAQDLYDELDEVNTRLASLERAVKAVGVRDKNAKGLERMLQEGCENEMLPVENWSAFTEKGGLRGSTDWMPIEQFVNAITQLTQRKQQLQRDLYELLGISDIMRGSTAASETATAQQLKVAYGGARLGKLQADVARFVSDVMRIRANIVCNHFQPETIKRRSLIEKTPDAQHADAAIELLKSEGLAQHAIKVDADALAAPDWEMEKRVRTEFMGAVSNYVMAAAPMAAQNPQAGIFLLKLLQWGAAGFKGAASIEGVIDQAVSQMEAQAARPPAPPPPSPEDQKNLAAAEKNKADAAKTGAEAEAQQLQNTVTKAVLPPQARPGPRPGMPMPGPAGGAPGAVPGFPRGLPPGATPLPAAPVQ